MSFNWYWEYCDVKRRNDKLCDEVRRAARKAANEAKEILALERLAEGGK